jgi:hypothetical protein
MPKKMSPVEFVDDVIAGDPDLLERYGWRNVPDLLKTSIRYLVRGRPGSPLVWVDWSAIEARILPWLTLDPRCDRRLDIFRENGDIYMETVREVYGVDDRDLRQAGKAMELSQGYCGRFNAMTTFCNNLGVQMTEREKQEASDKWHDANPWAQAFGDNLVAAFTTTFFDKVVTQVGRIMFEPGDRGVDVWMRLPGGRRLPYRGVHATWSGLRVTRYEDSGKPFEIRIWQGLLAENGTQATAASLLRDVLVRLHTKVLLCGHTHDEVIAESGNSDPRMIALAISREMVYNPKWLEGCPLNVEWSYGPRYGEPTEKGVL